MLIRLPFEMILFRVIARSEATKQSFRRIASSSLRNAPSRNDTVKRKSHAALRICEELKACGCSVCFWSVKGSSSSVGLKMAVLTLLAILACVLASLGIFFLQVRKRERLLTDRLAPR